MAATVALLVLLVLAAALVLVVALLCIVKWYYGLNVLQWYKGRNDRSDSGAALPLLLRDIDRRHSLQSYWKSIDDVLVKWSDSKCLENDMKAYNIKALVDSKKDALQLAKFCQTVRLEQLSIPTLVSLSLTLEHYSSSSEEISRSLCTILCSTFGSRCLKFRLAFDARSSFHELVFSKIQSVFQNDIVSHIANQARVGHERRRDPHPSPPPVQIVSDIDDTLYSVLFDKRYPPLTVYPGLHQFYHELAKVSGLMMNKLVFVTARPEMFRGRTIRHLRDCGVTNATILMGTFRTLWSARLMAQQKLDNFLSYRKLFPEYQFVFVGDNGQADIDLGKLLLQNNIASHVWIHDVIRDRRSHSTAAVPHRYSECQQVGIELFTSYIGATVCAIRSGVLPVQALPRVIEATATDLNRIVFLSEDQKAACRAELRLAANAAVEQLGIELGEKVENPFY